MKFKISFALISLYILSLVFTVPATLLTYFIPDNSGIKIGHVSGTLWNGQFTQVNYRHHPQLQQLNWQFDWLALLSLQLKADVTFSNGRQALQGNGAIAYGVSGLVLSNINVDMKAIELVPYLQLPVPVTPAGRMTLVIENGTQGTPYCSELDGYLVWHNALVETPLANIDLGSPSIDLSCADGNLVASLTQDSDQLTTHAKVVLSEALHYELKGDIIGREQLDPTIQQGLSWMGPKNAAGETQFTFKGRL